MRAGRRRYFVRCQRLCRTPPMAAVLSPSSFMSEDLSRTALTRALFSGRSPIGRGIPFVTDDRAEARLECMTEKGHKIQIIIRTSLIFARFISRPDGNQLQCAGQKLFGRAQVAFISQTSVVLWHRPNEFDQILCSKNRPPSLSIEARNKLFRESYWSPALHVLRRAS